MGSNGFESSMSLGKPCMGLFLQGGVKALSIVEAGLEFAMMTVGTIAIIFVLPMQQLRDERDSGSWRFYARLISWGYSYVYAISSIIVSQRLFSYASQRRTKGVLTCVYIAGILHALCILNYTLYTIFIRWFQPATMTAFLGFMLYKFYFFWVTICYIREIKRSERLNPALRQLSDEEIEEFFRGKRVRKMSYEGEHYKWDFEIPLTRLHLDDYLLGRGAFGIVHKASLSLSPSLISQKQGNGGEEGRLLLQAERMVDVAVKSVADGVDVTYFKALLSELKIMTCIGYHEHIVNLIGACTSEIKNRQLYIVVELCHLGSMENYLRSNRDQFQARILTERLNCLNSYARISTENNNYSHYITNTMLGGIETSDLMKWATQTACGMEFMANKKVIHGDLAARNVLLTKDKQVKISDFGLSRQLFSCSAYVKKKDEPLPWRWMSVEAICDLNFSTRSDVWSFGVTVWEYFTYAAVPYAGWNYGDEFIERLKCGGLRLERPSFVGDEIYEMMKRCWRLEQSLRPSFAELKEFFTHAEQQYTYPLQKDKLITS